MCAGKLVRKMTEPCVVGLYQQAAPSRYILRVQVESWRLLQLAAEADERRMRCGCRGEGGDGCEIMSATLTEIVTG